MQGCIAQHQKDRNRACCTTYHQVLLLSRLDDCNSFIMHQTSKNDSVFSEPMKAHVTHSTLSTGCGSSSRHECLRIEQPQAQRLPTSSHSESTSPPEAWSRSQSNVSWYHYREAQNHFRSPFLGGMIWFHFPYTLPVLACTNLNSVWNFVLQAFPVFICLFI